MAALLGGCFEGLPQIVAFQVGFGGIPCPRLLDMAVMKTSLLRRTNLDPETLLIGLKSIAGVVYE